MIIIFNLMSGKLVDNAEGESALVLPAQSMILTLEYPSGTIERLGRNWRVTLQNESAQISAERRQQFAQQLVEHWQGLTAQIKLSQSDETGYRVIVWLAGDDEPKRFWVQPQAGLLTEVISQKTWQLSRQQTTALSLGLLSATGES